jgi:serine/threonine-protein kinase ULK/ATG1
MFLSFEQMAPEILRYEKYDAKADLWSVGTVLYEMCAGKPPFKAQNHVELLKKIERGEDKIRFPDDKSSWNPEAAAANAGGNGVRAKPVSREIKDLVRRLLKRNPIQRMSFEEFFRDEVVEGETSRVKKPKVIKIPNPPPSMQATANTPPSARPPPTAAPIPIRSAPLPPPFAFPLPASPAPASFVAPITSYGQSPPSRTSSVSTTRPHAQPFSEPSSPPTTQPRPIPMSSARPPFAQQSSSPTYQTTSRMSPRRTPSSFEPSVGLRESDRRMSAGAGRRPCLGGRRDSSDSVGPAASSGVGFGDEDDDNYVVVEKRTVEINSLADGELLSALCCLTLRKTDSILDLASAELDAAFQRPIGTVARRRSSRSLLSRPLSAFTSGSSPPTSTGLSSSPHSNSFALSVTPPFALASSPSRPSPLQHNYSSSLTRPLAVPRAPSHLDSSPAPYSAGSAGSGHSFLPSSSSSHQQPHLHRYSSSPTTGGVLARAISIASGRIFGTSPSSAAAKGAGVVARATARRKALVGAGDADPAEIQLLNLLSDLAQKAHAIVEFADWKLAMLVSAAEGSALGTSNANSPGSSSGFQGGAGIGYHPSGGGTGMNRRKSSGAGSNSGSDASMFKLDVVAAESLILYLKALAFLQKGMEAAKVFWQEVMVGKVGAGGAEGGGIEASADLNECTLHPSSLYLLPFIQMLWTDTFPFWFAFSRPMVPSSLQRNVRKGRLGKDPMRRRSPRIRYLCRTTPLRPSYGDRSSHLYFSLDRSSRTKLTASLYAPLSHSLARQPSTKRSAMSPDLSSSNTRARSGCSEPSWTTPSERED